MSWGKWRFWNWNNIPEIGDYIQIRGNRACYNKEGQIEGFVMKIEGIDIFINSRPTFCLNCFVPEMWRKNLPPEEPKRIKEPKRLPAPDKENA